MKTEKQKLREELQKQTQRAEELEHHTNELESKLNDPEKHYAQVLEDVMEKDREMALKKIEKLEKALEELKNFYQK